MSPLPLPTPGGITASVAKVVSLHVYPIKACGGVAVSELELDARGPARDRRFMVVDADGLFMSQRKESRLALVRPLFAPRALILNAPGMEPLEIDLEAAGPQIEVGVWEDRCLAKVQLAGSGWVSAFLGTTCRLVHIEGPRAVKEKYGGAQFGFADAFPLLLTSRPSLDALNAKLRAPVEMERFRPNVVIDGCSPFFEDTLEAFSLGTAHLRAVKPCARCSVINVDQETGERGAEPLRTLTTFRQVGQDVLFGQNVVHAGDGRIRLGDELTVT